MRDIKTLKKLDTEIRQGIALKSKAIQTHLKKIEELRAKIVSESLELGSLNTVLTIKEKEFLKRVNKVRREMVKVNIESRVPCWEYFRYLAIKESKLQDVPVEVSLKALKRLLRSNFNRNLTQQDITNMIIKIKRRLNENHFYS